MGDSSNTNDANKSASQFKALRAKYDICEVMGVGSRGMVVRAVRKDNAKKQVAVKILSKSRLRSEEKLALAREVAVFHHVSHPHIVGFEESLEDNQHVYIITELLEGGDIRLRLNDSMTTFPKEQLFMLAEQMISAVLYLHSFGIAHRDIKLENFVFTSQNSCSHTRCHCTLESDHCRKCANGAYPAVKLIDFGMVYWRRPGGEQYSRHFCGTLGYTAPEVCKNAPYLPECADMWSLGVVLYALVARRLPFGHSEEARKWASCKCPASADFSDTEWDELSPKFVSLVKRLLDLNPKNRPSAAQALEIIVECLDDIMIYSETTSQELEADASRESGAFSSKRHSTTSVRSCLGETPSSSLVAALTDELRQLSERENEAGRDVDSQELLSESLEIMNNRRRKRNQTSLDDFFGFYETSFSDLLKKTKSNF
eukprot:CAMPEP_0182446866 /NCGR_PEP_ID=MMETSP1172-20130603/7878_1 /TAXON_ID=708627 /ORGANISM="Timspurckia oligopyrenoides, Strain CCMP3278" /LENGTH=427 /DNA_ID=CAMNT_0024643013 /DNA_START=290 /DNA_END=1571 /DNA_ORIENTATION=+